MSSPVSRLSLAASAGRHRDGVGLATRAAVDCRSRGGARRSASGTDCRSCAASSARLRRSRAASGLASRLRRGFRLCDGSGLAASSGFGAGFCLDASGLAATSGLGSSFAVRGFAAASGFAAVCGFGSGFAATFGFASGFTAACGATVCGFTSAAALALRRVPAERRCGSTDSGTGAALEHRLASPVPPPAPASLLFRLRLREQRHQVRE